MVPELIGTLAVEGGHKTTALCALEILARNFSPSSPETFSTALASVTSFLTEHGQSATEEDAALLSSCYLCVATMCGVLGARAFPQLPHLVPLALKRLGERSNEVLRRSALAVLVALAQHLSQFLHPYLEEILSLTHPLMRAEPASRLLVQRLHDSLATGVPLRLTLPVVAGMFEASAGKEALLSLLHFFTAVVSAAKAREVAAHLQPLSTFLLGALGFRAARASVESFSTSNEEDEAEVAQVENGVVEALVVVVMRMNEDELATFLVDLYEWKLAAGDDGEVALARRASFFACTEVLVERLKSIFVPYFDSFFDDCREELESTFRIAAPSTKAKKRRALGAAGQENDSETAQRALGTLSPATRRLQIRLLQKVVNSLCGLFQHDGAQTLFMTKERLQIIVAPLVRHLALAAVEKDYVATACVPCVAQLAAVAGADVHWKSMNFAILLHTRDPSPPVRLAALETLHQCFSVVGEEYLVMLPESLSFLSELLEDSDAGVETRCRVLLKSVEDLSGEKLEPFM